MDTLELKSPEQLTIPDQMSEEAAECALRSRDSHLNSLNTLADPFPDLPNFGLFYLSVIEAASLIAEDLAVMNRYPFSKLTHIPGSEPETESRKKRVRRDLVKRLERQILKSIAQGRLAYVRKPGNIVDFIDNDNEEFPARLIYVHYKHLLQWLMCSGYIKSELLGLCMALNDYAGREIELAKAVAETVKFRRKALNPTTADEDSINNEDFEEFIRPHLLFNHEDIVSQLFGQIHTLTTELDVLQRSVQRREEIPLIPKEERSVLYILAAVCKLKHITKWSASHTALVQKLTEEIGHPVSNTTVRKWLDRAITLLQ